MLKGNTCPVCNKSITTFTYFLKPSKPQKSIACQNCGASVTIKNSFVVFVLACVLIGLALPTFLLGTGVLEGIFSSFPKWAFLSLVIAYLVLWVFMVTFLSWLFIGWKKADVV